MSTPESTSETSAAWLEFSNGQRLILAELCSIGRQPGSQLVIDNERVSRRHAVIRRSQDGTYELMDMGSSNGTYLEGRRLDRPERLASGQMIEIGLLKMVFRLPPSIETADSAPAINVDCWLLVVEAAQRGTRTPSEHFAFKTVESWNERCHRVIQKYKGTPIRALKEGLVAYWRADGADHLPALVSSALLALRAAQKESEEFRFAVHFGTVTFKGDSSVAKPSGEAMIYALQLQRLVTAVDTLVLISEAASVRLKPEMPMRRLTVQEMRQQGGDAEFFTLRDS